MSVSRIRFLVVAMTLIAAVALPVPAVAECIGPWTPMPPFTKVAPSAERVIVGTVIRDLENTEGADEEGGVTASFVLRVDAVLRGPDPGATLAMDIVRTGVRMTGMCGGAPTVFATVGDQIAVAFDGRLASSRRPITAAAWIEGSPHELAAARAEILTLAEVERAVARMPDTSTADVEGSPDVIASLKHLLRLLLALVGIGRD